MRIYLSISAFAIMLLLNSCGSGSGSSTPLGFYTLGGNVSGLTNGSKVILENNGTDRLVIESNGTFVFRKLLAYNSSYLVTVAREPVGETCIVNNYAGSAVTTNVTNVEVLCNSAADTAFHSFSGSDGAYPSANLIIGSDGNFYGTTQGGGDFGNGTAFKIDFSGKEELLHSFGSGSDGAIPDASLVIDSSGNIYGTTSRGGAYGAGTVFKINSSGETVLYSFGSGSDGAYPTANLIIGSDGNFYGTTFLGGESNNGTVFKITSSGIENVIYSFGHSGSSDGANPFAGLIADSNGNLYGTTEFGGESRSGTVFKITSSGIESIIYSFGHSGSSDGANPFAGLIFDSNGNLYGTTYSGGAFGYGTVFKITSIGIENVIYSFSSGFDGAYPYANLIIGSDGNLYGTTSLGGESGSGTVFKTTNSGIETVLYSFSGFDGAYPYASLIIGSDGNLYGTTHDGGRSESGTVFKFVP